MKRKEVCPEFHRRRPFEDAAPLRRIVLRLRFSPETLTLCRLFRHHVLLLEISILERSENLGQILANVSGEHEAKGGIAQNFIVEGLSKTLRLSDFPRSLPISQSPCTVGYFSPLRKVLGT